MSGRSSRLSRQIEEVVASLNAASVEFALIGGLALASHRVIRATQDVDLLVDAGDADRVDLLYARRPVARRLLQGAGEMRTSMGNFRVVSVEGLIAFKLQGFVNDARRTRDLEDIRALLRANLDGLKMEELRGYFALFDREALLDELIREIRSNP